LKPGRPIANLEEYDVHGDETKNNVHKEQVKIQGIIKREGALNEAYTCSIRREIAGKGLELLCEDIILPLYGI
jgi:hypothetical protein